MVSEELPADAGAVLAGLAAGSRIAGYRLEEQVGAGGMAVVFRAVDEWLGRRVALKVLAPALASDAAFRQRFLRESRAAAAVDDPHIIPVHEAGEANGVLFIAMRYVPGGDVRILLHEQGPLSPDRAAAIISPVASALDAAHEAGLVHRDVKPANMLVDARPGRPDHVYLSDFGLSKGTASSAGLTGTGQYLGTPDYMAPEQIEGRAVEGRTDQYALACAAFELLCGEPPFRRDQGMAVLFAHLQQPPPSLASRRHGFTAAADAVFARALAKAPEDRYASCRQFAEALRSALGLMPYYSGPGASPAADHPATEIASPISSGTEDAALPADAAAASTVGSASAGTSAIAETLTRAAPPATASPGPSGDSSEAAADHPATEVARPADSGAVGRAVPSAVAATAASPGPGATADPAAWMAGKPALAALAATTAPDDGERTIGPRREGTPGHDATAPRDRRRGRGKAISLGAAGAAVVLGAGIAAIAGLHGPSPSPKSQPASRASSPVSRASSHQQIRHVIAARVLTGGSYAFKGPFGIATASGHVWVANYGDNSVTELNASNGNWVQTLSGGNYAFNSPVAIAADGTHVWVTNYGGNSVTELNASDGSWIRTVSGGNYAFNTPDAITADGAHIWVTNYYGGTHGGSVTELNANNGSWVRTLSGGHYSFHGPIGIAVAGGHVWVTNYVAGNSVTELNASDGSWVQTLSGGNYSFHAPDAIVADGANVWVSDLGGSVTELNASDGSVVRRLSGGNYAFNGPDAITACGGQIWVTNSDFVGAGSDTVTELNASDGSWVRTLSGGSYGFNNPVGIAADGTHVWVTNSKNYYHKSKAGGDSVTELSLG